MHHGDSQLTLVGFAAAGLALVMIVLGHLIGLESLKTAGMSVLTGGLGLVAWMARSAKASRAAHQEEQERISAVRLEGLRETDQVHREVEALRPPPPAP